MKITDAMLAKAAAEALDAIIKSLPDPKDCCHEFSPEFERKMAELLGRPIPQQDDLIDVTGTKLTPSWHGKDCQGNGEQVGIECCCDECVYYQECWPDWRELNEST